MNNSSWNTVKIHLRKEPRETKSSLDKWSLSFLSLFMPKFIWKKKKKKGFSYPLIVPKSCCISSYIGHNLGIIHLSPIP